MEKDFLKEIGYAGLTSRMKRLSDIFLYSIKEFYQSQNLDIEPNWHVVILLLKKKGALTNSEISEELQLSHPAVVKLINRMKEKDYIKSEKDAKDSRRTFLQLTEKAERKLPELQKCWDANMETLKDLTENSPEIFTILTIMEDKIFEENFKVRTEQHLEKINKNS